MPRYGNCYRHPDRLTANDAIQNILKIYVYMKEENKNCEIIIISI